MSVRGARAACSQTGHVFHVYRSARTAPLTVGPHTAAPPTATPRTVAPTASSTGRPLPRSRHLPLRPLRTRPLRRRVRPAFLPLPSAPVAVPPSPAASNSGADRACPADLAAVPLNHPPRPQPPLARPTAASPRAVDDRQALFAALRLTADPRNVGARRTGPIFSFFKLSPNLIYSSSFLLFITNLLHFHDKLLSLKCFSDKLLFNCHHI